MEIREEFVARMRSEDYKLPLLASACPGWVCYAEKTHGDYILPYISTVKSPQAVMGTLVKRYWARQSSIEFQIAVHNPSLCLLFLIQY